MFLARWLRRCAHALVPSPDLGETETRADPWNLVCLEDRYMPAILAQQLLAVAPFTQPQPLPPPAPSSILAAAPETASPASGSGVLGMATAAYQAPFLLDSSNALWAAKSDGSGLVNTGGFGTSLSTGTDLAGMPMAVIRDGNNRVYIFDQGTWIDTGGYAQDLVAGIHGEVFLRDGNNLIYHYQLGAGWEIAHSPGTGSTLDHYATQLASGQETVTNPATGTPTTVNVLAIRDPGNHVLLYTDAGSFVGGTPQATWTDTGGYAIDLVLGSQGNLFLRDGNNQVYAYNGSWQATGGYAASLAVGQDGTADYLAGQDLSSHVYVYQLAGSRWTDTGRTAQQVVAGTGEVYIRDLDNRVQLFNLTDQSWTDTGGFATRIGTAGPNTSGNPGPHDQLAILDGNHQLYLYNGTWTATPYQAVTLSSSPPAPLPDPAPVQVVTPPLPPPNPAPVPVVTPPASNPDPTPEPPVVGPTHDVSVVDSTPPLLTLVRNLVNQNWTDILTKCQSGDPQVYYNASYYLQGMLSAIEATGDVVLTRQLCTCLDAMIQASIPFTYKGQVYQVWGPLLSNGLPAQLNSFQAIEPFARAAAVIKERPELAAFLPQAQQYRDFAWQQVMQLWFAPSTGVYNGKIPWLPVALGGWGTYPVWTDNASLLGCITAELYAYDGNAVARDYCSRLIAGFEAKLPAPGSGVAWVWDQGAVNDAGNTDQTPDTSHTNRIPRWFIEAYRTGLVGMDTLQSLGTTLLSNVWDQSAANYRDNLGFNNYIDGANTSFANSASTTHYAPYEDGIVYSGWAMLGRYNPQARALFDQALAISIGTAQGDRLGPWNRNTYAQIEFAGNCLLNSVSP